MPMREFPKMRTHKLKIFTLVNVLHEKTKTNSQFRISGLMNSKIEVSGLWYTEIKQKSKHTCEKMDLFWKWKIIAIQATRFHSFKNLEWKENQL